MASHKLSNKEHEVVELAAQEGHDADIPSNFGVVTQVGVGSQARAARDSTKSPAESVSEKDAEKDLEKGALSSELEPVAVKTIDDGNDDLDGENNEVGWDGDDDPNNPMNWPSRKKWGAVSVVAAITFLTPLGSSIFAPGVPKVMSEFHSDSELLSGFVVSVYVLGFAFGPLVIAPLSELYGRLWVYHINGVLFVIFTIACALSSSLNMLIAFRFLAGTVGAAPLTLGGGTIADLMKASQRAKAMSVWVIGPTLGPVLGPIAGGFISESLGWRWNFWILSIAAGIFCAAGIFLMNETYAPVLLERKAKRLRKETGNQKLKSKLDIGLTAKDLFWFSIARPTKMLLFSPIVLFLSIYVAITYAYLYMFFTTITEVFENQYHFKTDLSGLAFLGIGVGQFGGQFVYSYIAGRTYKKYEAKNAVKPEQRLQSMLIGAVLIPISLFWYGWSIQANVQWMCPIVATSFFSMGLLFIWMPANVYLIDVYTVYAASAMAANTVLRSVVAAVLPIAGPKMYAALGYGWGNSLLGFIALAMFPIPLIFMKYGEGMRMRSTLKL